MNLRLMSSIHRRVWPSSNSFFTNSKNSLSSIEDLYWKNDDEALKPDGQFNIVSFNMLAPCYKRLQTRDSSGHRTREASDYELWNTRAKNTLKFLQKEMFEKRTAIIGLQEYWLNTRYTTMFQQEFIKNGYEMNLLQRTGSKVDAVAVMVRSDTFDTLGSENIYLCSLNDRVALMLWLRHKATGKNILVANTHLSFPHNAADRRNQMRQMEILTQFIDQFAARNHIQSATRIVLGDFNVEGHSPVCNHLRASGYYSCFEVCPPVNRSPTPISTTADVHVVSTTTTSQTTTDSLIVNSGIGFKIAEISLSGNINSDTLEALHLSSSGATVCGRPGQHIVTYHPDPEAEQENEGDDLEITILAVETKGEEIRDDDTSLVPSSFPPAAPLHHHQYCSVIPSDYFVSHHTHKEEDLGVDHIFIRPELVYDTDQEGSSQLREGVFVAASQVLPAALSCSEWPLDFASISDHRPVQASVVFGRCVDDNTIKR